MAASSYGAPNDDPPMSGALLIVRAGIRLCGLAAQHVAETMRPLPCEPLPQAPPFVRGVSLIRGQPTPVVDLRELFDGEQLQSATRIVTLRSHDVRQVALLVDAVLGIRQANEISTAPLAPLLEDARAEVVQDLARLDEKLLTILQAGNLVPDAVWQQLPKREASA